MKQIRLQIGQISLPIASVGAILVAAVSWTAAYFGNLSAQSAAVGSVQANIDKVDSRVSLLCNDYGQTVSRVDQNLQAIGRALKVSIVSGNSNVNPCPQTK